jgi:WD40 repeat protein
VWDFSGSSCETHATITAPEGFQVLSARFSPDGKEVVTVGVDQVARQWSADDGQAITSTLPLTDQNVRDAFLSPDGKSLLVLSTSKKANLYDADQWRESTVLGGHDKNITTGSFSPDGRLVVTAGEDQIVHIHLVRFADVVETAKQEIAKRALPVGGQ